ncbi:ABC transporter ATP-binding protein [Ruminiclostridium herbifermentans]|uniref:ABC transporter ATP-binding protein n=1 Tax=Ruminiclostridium herbifermentans TaxID=2488810 RepID=A0A4U7J7W1_9FIRM|nr:ABC transporter ATP-binding protein [Ruminiclostridium herbifermentans]QNU66426.1 ABC transporter ATP-binding protein [Ruminiclostridium herbifermentans]
MKIIQAEGVSYYYQTKYQKIEALKDITCFFETGKMYAIVGESGSGKSTFLSLIAGLDLPTSGSITIDGKEIRTINRDHYRRDLVTVVYQAFHLFPLLTALENVMFPMTLKGMSVKQARSRAKELVKKVGLGEKTEEQFPQMMSGGEQQRVAIARAMASYGKILLADEPTGNLDTQNEENIVSLLKKMAHEEQYAVIVVTHNPGVAQEADVILRMKDGSMIEIRENDEKKMRSRG